MNKDTGNINQARFENFTFWAMVIFAIAGVYFRLKGLGKWSFTNDEYYLAQSVRYILETGLPQFPCGGYYTRGLIYQYLMAPFIAIGMKPEFAFRLLPVLSHIVALPGLYLLAKRITGKPNACLIVSIYSLSLIEVEISRFARMYLPFQALFIWYLYFLNKCMQENDLKSFRFLFCLSAIGPFVFEGGIFLALLNFLPFIDTSKITLKRLASTLCIFLIAYIFLSMDFRHFPLGKQAYWPPELTISHGGGKIVFPYLIATSFPGNSYWLILFFAVAAFSAFGIYKIFRDPIFTVLPKLSLAACIFLSLSNLFGLLIITIIILHLFSIIRIGELKKSLSISLIAPVSINFAFFVVYGLLSPGTYGPLADPNPGAIDPIIAAIFSNIPHSSPYLSELLNLFFVLFYYPTGLPGILYTWIKVYPFLIAFLTVFIIIGAVISGRQDENITFKLNLAIVLFLLTIVGSLAIRKGTRYTFFLYPIVILLAIDAMNSLASKAFKSKIKSKLAVIIIFFFVFLSSKDFNLHHLYFSDSAAYAFKIDFHPKLKSHFIMRRDYKGVAAYIDKHVHADDIVISAHQAVHFYTSKVNYILLGHKNRSFKAYTACNGKKDIWTNADLIYNSEQLFDILDNSHHDIWIVVNMLTPRYDEELVTIRYKDNLVFSAQDGILGIYKIRKTT